MFLNIFTPYHDYYNAITANCNDFGERLEVLEILEVLDFFGKYLQSGKKQYVIKSTIPVHPATMSFSNKKIHGNTLKP